MKITLYELFTLININECEISDNTLNYYVDFSCFVKKGQCKTNCDLLMRYFSTKIECNDFHISLIGLKHTAHCDVIGFIIANINPFFTFIQKHNKNFKNDVLFIGDKVNEDLFRSQYLDTFTKLIRKEYTDEQCGELLKLLQGGSNQ